MDSSPYNPQLNLPDHDRRSIRTAIETQLRALEVQDGEAAFAQASPGIQSLFGTPQAFLQMVHQSYAPLCHPRAVLFESLTLLQDNWTQPVLLLSRQGTPIRALYLMEQQPNLRWKINGCYLVPIHPHP